MWANNLSEMIIVTQNMSEIGYFEMWAKNMIEIQPFKMWAKNMSEMMMVGRISQGQRGVMHG